MGEARRAPGVSDSPPASPPRWWRSWPSPRGRARSGFDARPSPSTRSRPRPARPSRSAPGASRRRLRILRRPGRATRRRSHMARPPDLGRRQRRCPPRPRRRRPRRYLRPPRLDRRRRPRRPRPIPVLLRPQGALRVELSDERRGHLDHRPRRRREPLVRRLLRRVHALPLPVGRGVGDAHDGRRAPRVGEVPRGRREMASDRGGERRRRRREGRFPSPPPISPPGTISRVPMVPRVPRRCR